jgi:hypothetical protein
MDKIYWGIIILVVSSTLVFWAIRKIQDMFWKPEHPELYKEFKKVNDANLKEATTMYPARKNMSDKELEETKDRQSEYASSANDVWYRRIQERNELTDSQLAGLKREFQRGIMRGK